MIKFLRWPAITLALATGLSAIEVVNNEKGKLDVGGSFQLLGNVQGLNDPYKDDVRSYMFLKTARLTTGGEYEGVKFRVELALGGEEQIKGDYSGSVLNASMSLLDAYADAPLLFGSRFRFGQMLVPFGRERLVYERDSQFVGRSINNLATTLGRDVGGTLYGNLGVFAYAFGLYAGGGRDVPERYIPAKLGTPMLVAKVGINNGADDDILTVNQGGVSTDKLTYGVYLSGMYQKDSLVGHSTVDQVRMTEYSLIMSPTWNPYLSQKGGGVYGQGDLMQFAIDAIVRVPVSGMTVATELEANVANFSNEFGTMTVPGGRAQMSLLVDQFEVAARYSMIALGNAGFGYNGSYNAATSSYTAGSSNATIYRFLSDDRRQGSNSGNLLMNQIQEIGMTVSYYFKNRVKAMVEVSLSDVPVVSENNSADTTRVGAYSLLQQPEQSKLIAANGTVSGVNVGSEVTRQLVKDLRIMLQYRF